MEVEQHTMEQRTLENEQDTDNAESSFEVLMKSIKAIEKQSKCMKPDADCPCSPLTPADLAVYRPPAREQQLTSKLEQERLKWQQEKQELLEQLRMKQTPTKNIKRYMSTPPSIIVVFRPADRDLQPFSTCPWSTDAE